MYADLMENYIPYLYDSIGNGSSMVVHVRPGKLFFPNTGTLNCRAIESISEAKCYRAVQKVDTQI